jgi:peptidoglycan/LPS O-acetylase OafA/YrhL
MTVVDGERRQKVSALPGSAESAYLAYRAQSRFGSLDGLRCLCILAVIWHHSPWWTAMTDAPRLLQRGFVGVDFFFVLSGFLITTLLLREEEAKGRFSLRGFYWRRALRILPVYFFVVTAVALYYIGVKGQTDYLSILPYYYVFLSNFLAEHIPLLSPTWSLAVEEQYYLIWPLALLILPRRWVPWLLALAIALNVAGAMGVLGLSAAVIGPLQFSLPNSTYAPILIGSVLALMLNSHRGFSALWPVLGSRLAAPATLVMVVILLQILPDDLRGLPNLALHLAMALALAALVMREDHLLSRAMGWRPVARVGEISYGIYLYHLIALHVATVATAKLGIGAGPVVLLTYATISVVMAEISDRTLERFFRRFRGRGPGTVKTGAL